ncbi:MAG: hypothetical protein M1826_002844 [Phylliscum demangeonii]|nr:MAG: hypothetical protein M1826_002844 [Phylliscum demangeonii]
MPGLRQTVQWCCYGLATNAAKAARQSVTLFMVASAPYQVWESSQLYQSGE